MLRIEKGGNEQLADELTAYNPLIHVKREKGYEISATMMIVVNKEAQEADKLVRAEAEAQKEETGKKKD